VLYVSPNISGYWPRVDISVILNPEAVALRGRFTARGGDNKEVNMRVYFF
jgi:hypothetical protein